MNRFMLAFALLSIILGGCQTETTGPPAEPGSGTSTESTATRAAEKQPHPALEVANQILTAIHDGDADTIKSHFNETNRNKIGAEQFTELIDGAREMIGEIRSITELRRGTRPEVVLAKIREQGDEVFVFVLELEDGSYRLEDINSPSSADFNSMEMLQ